jgi:hypothetical protein
VGQRLRLWWDLTHLRVNLLWVDIIMAYLGWSGALDKAGGGAAGGGGGGGGGGGSGDNDGGEDRDHRRHRHIRVGDAG